MDVPEINSISPGTPQEGNFRSEADKNSFRERGVRREICGTKKTAYRLEPPRKEILGAKRIKIPSAREVRREICGTKKTAYHPAPPEGNFRSEAEKNSFREGGGEGDMRN